MEAQDIKTLLKGIAIANEALHNHNKNSCLKYSIEDLGALKDSLIGSKIPAKKRSALTTKLSKLQAELKNHAEKRSKESDTSDLKAFADFFEAAVELVRKAEIKGIALEVKELFFEQLVAFEELHRELMQRQNSQKLEKFTALFEKHNSADLPHQYDSLGNLMRSYARLYLATIKSPLHRHVTYLDRSAASNLFFCFVNVACTFLWSAHFPTERSPFASIFLHKMKTVARHPVVSVRALKQRKAS